MNRRLLTTLLIALGLVVAIPASATAAKVKVAVGIGDQSSKMFADKNWQALGVKKTRYFIEWNAIDQDDQLRQATAFVNAAQKANVKVLMHISVDNINSERKLPSLAAYKQKVGKLIALYKPLGVTDWGAWNEANHKSQPTSSKPKAAADFYKAMKAMCSGCNIVALDVLDQSGVERYIARWMKAAGSAAGKAKIFGIHNYSEVNRKLKDKRPKSASFKKYPGTKRIIDAVRKKNSKARFWYTETGGAAQVSSLKCDKNRQASTTKFMFDLAKKYDRYIERLYTYNWFGSNCDRFDAGLVEANGTPRKAYSVLKSKLSSYGK